MNGQKYVELTDFGRIRSRLSTNKELSHESWRRPLEAPEGVNQADGRLDRTR